jgi:hypothetical protein
MLSVKTSITIDDSDPNDFYKTLLMNDLKEIKKNTVIYGLEKKFKKNSKFIS